MKLRWIVILLKMKQGKRALMLSGVLLALLLAPCVKTTAESVTQSAKEKKDFLSVAQSGKKMESSKEMNDEIKDIAIEEIERTSQEAVKAALLDVGVDLAEANRQAELYKQKAYELEMINESIMEENEKLRSKAKFWEIAGGVSATTLILALTVSIVTVNLGGSK